MPLDFSTWSAAGPVSVVSNALTASGFRDLAAIPAAYTVMFWISFGSGPTKVTPFTGTISLICWIPISASPLTTRSAT